MRLASPCDLWYSGPMNTDEGSKRRRGVLRSLEKRGTRPVRSHLLQTGMVLALCILLIGSFLGHSVEARIFQDLEYARVGERSLKLDLYIPPHKQGERLPLVVWVHGGAWISGDKANPRAPRELGDRYIVASINYRLSKEATFPAQIYDCKAAIRWLRANADQYDIDPDRIGAWGGSAGGHLVALLGTSGEVEELEGDVGDYLDRSSAVQAVCDFYGPTDLASLYDDTAKMDSTKNPLCLLFGGIPTEHPDLLREANPITHVSPDDPPFLIMHGDKDLVVPLQQSELLYAALQEARVESTLRVIEGCEHGGFPPEAYEEVRRFFDEHLAVTSVGETEAIEAGNLLTNGGFASGQSDRPDGWTTFALPGGTGVPVFTWDET